MLWFLGDRLWRPQAWAYKIFLMGQCLSPFGTRYLADSWSSRLFRVWIRAVRLLSNCLQRTLATSNEEECRLEKRMWGDSDLVAEGGDSSRPGNGLSKKPQILAKTGHEIRKTRPVWFFDLKSVPVSARLEFGFEVDIWSMQWDLPNRDIRTATSPKTEDQAWSPKIGNAPSSDHFTPMSHTFWLGGQKPAVFSLCRPIRSLLDSRKISGLTKGYLARVCVWFTLLP